ncbi:MAG TPA: GIY-YIG nuclease family protein [Candidatus Cybelea sp.]|jgi:putative endonuclease|nr:GIY-YIG nuclease family protein [Candidatus Cybelea sp.]
MSESLPTVYVLACRDGSLYTGATVDLARRLEAHRRRKAAKYTRSRLPVTLVAWWHVGTFAAAKSHEARFKRLTRAAKLAALQCPEIYGCAVYVAGNLGTQA